MVSSTAGDDRSTGDPAAATTERDRSPTWLAQELLVACRRGDETNQYRSALADLDYADLAPIRGHRETALAFWVNCYNAGTQLLLDERPELCESALRFLRFFRASAITVAGIDLSLDRIENGLLRGGHSKYGLGYLQKLFVTPFERHHRLSDCDPRIHFALNCGAASCPPIRAYEPKRIDDQLDLATRGYLETTVEYDQESGVARVPRVFLWFRGDFGGGDGIRQFLQEYEIIPRTVDPTIRHLSWDWSKAADNFTGTE